ncbi:MAG: hypothetical protein ABSF37_05275 [Sedimentisphaerales bacterium]|jgi:hypothetical protein
MKELVKMENLGISAQRMAEYDVLFLPENILSYEKKDDLFESLETTGIYKVFKANQIKCANASDLGIEVSILERRSNESWLGIIALIGPCVISIPLNILSCYIYDRWLSKKKPAAKSIVHLTLIGNDPEFKFDYSGNANGLVKILKGLADKEGGNSGRSK